MCTGRSVCSDIFRPIRWAASTRLSWRRSMRASIHWKTKSGAANLAACWPGCAPIFIVLASALRPRKSWPRPRAKGSIRGPFSGTLKRNACRYESSVGRPSGLNPTSTKNDDAESSWDWRSWHQTDVLTALSDVCCLGKSLTQSGLLRFHWVDFPLTSQLLSFWRLAE